MATFAVGKFRPGQIFWQVSDFLGIHILPFFKKEKAWPCYANIKQETNQPEFMSFKVNLSCAMKFSIKIFLQQIYTHMEKWH